ncbi:predicted protein [Verticillium alfalfae VaMs.102]|uniref:Predicted protein n=1 Tax=Verticillium alfalfae (strain VaMs.102 / ATCC MYA-4576 / FGSC 10136) TaxID=526221 RepID=C9SHI3_VERA1|nr:predicted protein [Verticillium alfalfae VaMs.102]EEY18406.1 predicted protein [Verticillium alfalfae VaMs.102]
MWCCHCGVVAASAERGTKQKSPCLVDRSILADLARPMPLPHEILSIAAQNGRVRCRPMPRLPLRIGQGGLMLWLWVTTLLGADRRANRDVGGPDRARLQGVDRSGSPHDDNDDVEDGRAPRCSNEVAAFNTEAMCQDMRTCGRMGGTRAKVHCGGFRRRQS